MLLLFSALLLLFAARTDHDSCGSAPLAFPGEHWSSVQPEEAGFDADGLADLEDKVRGAGWLTYSGRLVHAWGPYDERADIGSAVKPILVHLLLKAYEDGRIDSLDQPVARYAPGLRDLNPELGYKDRKITWRHMARQISGYGVKEAPGEAFDYSDLQMALLCDALILGVYGTAREDATRDVLQEHLTGPLGCQDEPRFTAEGRLRMSARDLARIGLLYLAEGCWNGEHLLDRDLVSMAVSSPLPPNMPRTAQEESELLPDQRAFGGSHNLESHMNSYSYCWWLNGTRDDGVRVLPDAPPDTFGAFGHGGRHAVVIIPSRGLVLAWVVGLGNSYPQRFSIDGRGRVNRAVRAALAAQRTGF